jgi:hypothetical protein
MLSVSGLHSVNDGIVNEYGAIEGVLYWERSSAYVTCSRVFRVRNGMNELVKQQRMGRRVEFLTSIVIFLFCHLKNDTGAHPAFRSVDAKCSFHKLHVVRALSSWCLDADSFTFFCLL